MSAAIELQSASVLRGGYRVLDQVSTSFEEGSVTCVMGLSGSGKSTLLKLAAGITPQDEGTVSWFGKDISELSEKELVKLRTGIGFVFQDAALWANMSVQQNLALPMQIHRPELGDAAHLERIKALCKTLNFDEDLALRPSLLSSGERKIVSFMRALVLEPSVLFLDEPTSFVDNASAERITRMLKSLKREGCTIIMATHNPKLTAQLADGLLLLKHSRVIANGPLQKVSQTTDPDAREILTDLLQESATYDKSILDLMGN